MAALAASSQLVTAPVIAQAATQAATTATGTITGRVINAGNGMYLPNARVTLTGTNVEAFTNQFGEYTLNNVPAGSATIQVFYTGQEPQTSTVVISPGASTVQNISFNADQSTVADDGTLVLNEFTVAANRFRNAQELAINETRTAVNIKNIISVDQFGDIPSGNVGELVKFLPGVQIDYGSSNQGYADSDASAISVRGFGPEDTAILLDGLPIASSSPGSLTRQVSIDQLSINNASRVELIKVATPDMPANSMGGQINLITKSAFEFAKPSYSGRVYFNINSLTADWGKTVGPTNKSTYKTQPGFEISVTQPFSDKLGISFTGSAANEATQTYRAAPTYAYIGNFSNLAGTPLSISNPALTRFQVTDIPRLTERRTANLRLDWKPTPAQVLKFNVGYSTYEAAEAQRRLDFRPIVNNGADWSSTYTNGNSVGNGATAMVIDTRDRTGDTRSGQVQYSYQRSGWNIGAAASIAISEGEYVDTENGHYSGVALNLNPGRVHFENIKDGIPGSISTYWRSNAGALANTPKDYTTLSNWSFDGTTAKSGQSFNKTTNSLYKLDIDRDLSFLPFLGNNALSVKIGARRDEEKMEKTGRGSNYREILQPGKSYVVADILDTHYAGQSPGFGLPPQQWASTYALFELNKTLDLFYVPDFDEPTNTRVENYVSYVNQQKSMTETTDGWYAMLSGRFFSNRLALVGGMRQERKMREGYGPFTDSKWNFLRRPDGSLYTDATYPGGVQIDQGNGSVLNGVLITVPTNRPLFNQNAAGDALRQSLTAQGIVFPAIPYGPNNQLASRKLQLIPNRYVNQDITGDPSYSLSSSFKLTSKIDLKAAWSRSFGLPKLEDGNVGLLSGNNGFTINEYSETERLSNQGYEGNITVANPAVKPQTSDNWDLEVSYYTDSGGKLGVAYYYKTVTDQIETITTNSASPVFNQVITALGLDPIEYQNWRLSTSTNSSTKQKTSGWEFEARQDFRFLGNWGKNFQGFATYAMKNLADPSAPTPVSVTSPDGTVVNFVPAVNRIVRRADRFGGAGLQFSGGRLSAQIRGTYSEENEVQQIVLAGGNVLREFAPEDYRVDVTLGYTLTKNFSLFISGRDVLTAERKTIWRDDQGVFPANFETASYREFGTVWSVGVNARF